MKKTALLLFVGLVGLLVFAALRGQRAPRARPAVEDTGRAKESLAPVAAEWPQVIAAIEASPLYGGLRIVRQEGLAPLGADPRSGLHEFVHLGIGAVPGRAPGAAGAPEQLAVRAETGLVLVLLPGGTFLMGAQRDDPAAPHYDPDAEDDESPPHEIRLDPFFLSKYELTQAQWERLAGARPSRYTDENRGGATHPVEQVNWADCRKALKAAGLVLPTEAQWEYAARAGTDGPYWCGAEAADLAAVGANLLDVAARDLPPLASWDRHETFDDGFLVHSPVGSFAPNPFGLHDLIGNVREWCRDRFGAYDLPVRAGDGLRLVPEGLQAIQVVEGPWETTPQDRVIRGSCFRFGRRPGRSAGRLRMPPPHVGAPLGVRPARSLEAAGDPIGALPSASPVSLEGEIRRPR